jgi:hypothetical protein
MTMTKRTFTCAHCEETMESDWTEEDVAAEFKANFGDELAKDDCEQLCDDCYVDFMGWHGERTPEELKE